jgi:membrane protein YdbS with pleckstrin-like domain
MQSRLMSAVETATNIAVGLVVSFMAQLMIFDVYDISITLSQNVELTLFFTVVSLIRSYALRRFFNNLRTKI